ncbi:GNAT family N-acetyltransferase [Alkalicoccobacillus porphyridii]|uniref:GNAT family N-acetyltransferase n=1 Tax=Alkalicoccobacillus porphyridii TaxID=2597270 RepID=UPI0021B0CDD6|nr:GNAT family protein [Alkalicoccobacillus porphyridii]
MSNRVYLRKLEPTDLLSLHQALDDEEILYMTGTRRTFTFEQVQQFYKKCVEDDTRHDFAICLTENDRLIGDLAIMNIETEDHKAAFRIALYRTDLTGKGYGTEAVKQAIEFAFDELGLNRLQLEVYSHNPRGYHAYKKAGFIEEGRLRQTLYMNGQYSDEIIMSVLREDYEARRG